MKLKKEHLEGIDDRLPDLKRTINSILNEKGFKHLEVEDFIFRLSECTPPPPCASGRGRWVRNPDGGFDCQCQP